MTLLTYGKKDRYYDTIQRARERCEAYSEEQLYSRDGARGAQFALINNNDGWTDKKAVDITADDITITLTGNADSD